MGEWSGVVGCRSMPGWHSHSPPRPSRRTSRPRCRASTWAAGCGWSRLPASWSCGARARRSTAPDADADPGHADSPEVRCRCGALGRLSSGPPKPSLHGSLDGPDGVAPGRQHGALRADPGDLLGRRWQHRGQPAVPELPRSGGAALGTRRRHRRPLRPAHPAHRHQPHPRGRLCGHHADRRPAAGDLPAGHRGCHGDDLLHPRRSGHRSRASRPATS